MMPGRRFSFMRMINNAVPNFAKDDPNDVDLSPTQADNLLRYQLLLPHPRYLESKSFAMAGIAGSEALSAKVYRSLVKAGIILPYPGASSPSSSRKNSQVGLGPEVPVVEEGQAKMTVNTTGITSKFASQMAVISVHAQRKLVGMLFFWEEECTRWNLLDQEEDEIKMVLAMEGNGGNVDLRLALSAVQMRKTMLPSKRMENRGSVSGASGVAAGPAPTDDLPSYAGSGVAKDGAVH